MLNSRYRVVFYSFGAFTLFLLVSGFFMKHENVLAFFSKYESAKNQSSENNNIKQAKPLPEEIAPQEGFIAPDFTFPDMNGKSVSLSQFRGKVVFLNIWATWCGPCRIEMPDMEKLYRKFKKEDLVILAVSIDRHGEPVVKPFVKELELTFPILLSPDGRIQRIYMVNALPSSFIIDKSGRILTRVVGARNWFGAETIETFEYLIRKT